MLASIISIFFVMEQIHSTGKKNHPWMYFRVCQVIVASDAVFPFTNAALPVFVVGFSRPLKSQHTCTKSSRTNNNNKKDHRRNERGQQ